MAKYSQAEHNLFGTDNKYEFTCFFQDSRKGKVTHPTLKPWTIQNLIWAQHNMLKCLKRHYRMRPLNTLDIKYVVIDESSSILSLWNV